MPPMTHEEFEERVEEILEKLYRLGRSEYDMGDTLKRINISKSFTSLQTLFVEVVGEKKELVNTRDGGDLWLNEKTISYNQAKQEILTVIKGVEG